jgi:transcriptional regulator with XRE-family HTH domain
MLSKLKLKRMSNGIKQKTVAKKAKLSCSIVSRIENGKIAPSERAKKKIAKALGVSVDAIFQA